MSAQAPSFTVKLAQNDADITAAQRLRYDVFVSELGGDGPMVDHAARLERDPFDARADHLLLIDNALPEAEGVVGVYRLMRSGGYYCENEYDLSALMGSGRRLLELGRSCVHRDYRGGTAMMHLWRGLAGYVQDHDIEVLFGVASFHGTDVTALKYALSALHARYLAPKSLRPCALVVQYQRMDLVDAAQIDYRRAMLAMPALIKAYLRLGGLVGEGAFVDHAFNTTDVCMILDTNEMNARLKRMYTGR